uniref:Uncharacterized protein n=1 Tax=Arundo donax TaxID=35708 RepID=A0A0A9H8X5_ARUDO
MQTTMVTLWQPPKMRCFCLFPTFICDPFFVTSYGHRR